MSVSESTATYILESLLPRFEAEGFDVFLHPSPSILPSFMKDHPPDAIAISPHKKIAIEVVRPIKNSEKIAQLQKLIAEHSDWELRVLRIPSSSSQIAIEVASRTSIERAIEQV